MLNQTLSHFRPLLDRGWTFGALDEEGLLPVNLERFAKYRFSTESAKVFDDVFFFGEAQKNIFEDIYGTNDSFVVSGNLGRICGRQTVITYMTRPRER